METVILVMWFGTTYGGPSMMEVESMAKCRAIRVAMLTEYAPHGLLEENEKSTWTTRSIEVKAGERSKCITVKW